MVWRRIKIPGSEVDGLPAQTGGDVARQEPPEIAETPVNRKVRSLSRSDRIFRVVASVASLALVVFIVVVLVSPDSNGTSTHATFPNLAPASLKIGALAPVFTLRSLSGTTPVDLAHFRGSPVLLNFFASWCSDCREDLSTISAFARVESGKIDVVGIDTNDSNTDKVKGLLEDSKADYPVALDPVATVASWYLIETLPVTYFIGPKGRVTGVIFGKLTKTELTDWANSLGLGSAP